MLTNARASRAVAITLGIACLVTAATGTGVAIAAAKWNAIWANGTIHQCLDNKTFATRTMPRNHYCRSTESGYSFNQKGLKGDRGLTGAPGTAGLSASTFSDDALAPAPPNDSSWTRTVIKTATITTSQSGKLLILDATVESCSLNNTALQPYHYHLGVYVDGVGVPGTYDFDTITVPASSGPYSVGPTPIELAPAATASLAAGTHTVTIELITDETTVNYMTGGSGKLFVVASK